MSDEFKISFREFELAMRKAEREVRKNQPKWLGIGTINVATNFRTPRVTDTGPVNISMMVLMFKVVPHESPCEGYSPFHLEWVGVR